MVAGTLPSRAGVPRRADVAVIGGGVVGVACALELARRGAEVCVLERDRVGHGCSYANAGWLTISLALPLAAPGQLGKAVSWLTDPESPFAIRPRLDPGLARWLLGFVLASRRGPYERGAAAMVELCRFSVERWEELAGDPGSPPFGYRRSGLVEVYETPRALDAALARARLTERLGEPFEAWSAAELAEREPSVRGGQIGGLFFPNDAHCEPYAAVQAVAAAARRAGATIVEGAEVVGCDSASGELLLLTSRGPITAREVVLAAGVWSGSLGRRMGVRLPMRGGKGYSVVVPRCEPHPRRPVYLAERKIAVTPHATSLRVAGTLELVGEDLAVDQRRARAVIAGARSMLTLGSPAGETEVWSGLRPCLPDGMPAIGRARGHRALWIATGHHMTGLKTALGTGVLLAELMSGEAPTFDLEPFRADRF